MNRSDFLKSAALALGTRDSHPGTRTGRDVDWRERRRDHEPIDVRAFGALGDGVADDTAAIEAALREAGRAGGTVRLPVGTYRCNVSLRTSNVRLLGDGLEATVLVPASEAPVVTLDARGGPVERCEVADLSITRAPSQPAVDGIRIVGSHANDYHLLRRLHIRGCRRGLDAPGRLVWLHLQDVEVKDSLEDGLSFTGDVCKNAVLMEFVRSAGNRGKGLYASADYVDPWSAWCFINCNFELNDSVGVHLDGAVGYSAMSFDCCYFEDNARTVRAGSEAPPKATICVTASNIFGLGVRDSLFLGANAGASDPEYGIHIDSSRGEVSVDGCRFQPVKKAAVVSSVRLVTGQNRVGGGGTDYVMHPGTAHTRLEAFLTGTGAPTSALGENGDLYVRRDGAPGRALFFKVRGRWSPIA